MTSSLEPGSAGEISLDDIDSLIAADDPSFASGLEAIREVAADEPVEIESSVPDEESGLSPEDTLVSTSFWNRIPVIRNVIEKLHKRYGVSLQKWRGRIFAKWLKVRARSLWVLRTAVTAIRTFPSQISTQTKKILRLITVQLKSLRAWFGGLSRIKQTTFLAFMAGVLVFTGLLILNLRGFWLPIKSDEAIHSLAERATRSWSYGADEQMIPFLQAFPQVEHGFEFSKMVVNLKRSVRHSNPMGFFEIYAVFDGRDAAVEAQAREKELSDLLQRMLEEIPYEEVQGPLGRKRLKDLLRQELNSVLNHGWAHEIYIKNMVLKP